jgi:hypothetical protein
MSDDYDQPIAHHDPSEGFDPSEPEVKSIWGFAIGAILVLLVTIGALEHYFEKVWNDAVYEKVLAVPSELLQQVRGRDDWDLTHSMYLNKDTGQVRIPLDHAQELFLQEVAAGKPFYPGKSTAPKKDDAEGWQGLAADTPAAGSAPAAGSPAPAAGAAPGTPAAPAVPAAEKK